MFSTRYNDALVRVVDEREVGLAHISKWLVALVIAGWGVQSGGCSPSIVVDGDADGDADSDGDSDSDADGDGDANLCGSVDCTHLDGPCSVGACDPETGACEAQPEEDGTICNDGNTCTLDDQCTEGVCGGSMMDCSALDDGCRRGRCDPETGACEATPVEDETACDDGDVCTTGEVCAAGVCEPGTPLDCSHLDTECTEGECNSVTGSCQAVRAPDDSVCDDANLCTIGDICTDGVCSGELFDCSAVDDDCNEGVCDPETGACVRSPLPGDTVCDDGEACTNDDVCTDGSCGGTPMDCSSSEDDCNDAVCNSTTGACEPVPLGDGTGCDDGDPCTTGDTCSSGVCGGGPMDCTHLDGGCAVGECDPTTGACTAVNLDEGASCDDGDPCTVDDACAGGRCDGMPVVTADNDTCAAPELLSGVDGLRTVAANNVCSTDTEQGTCHGTGGRELIYAFELTAPRRVILETVAPLEGEGFDTTLYVRTECDAPSTEVSCDDDGGAGLYSLIDRDFEPGAYTLFVDSFGSTAGNFELEMEVVAPEGCAEAASLELPAPGDISFLSGSTEGASDDFTSTCAGSAASPDHAYEFTLSRRSHLIFETLAPETGRYDTALHLRGAPCEEGAGTTIACNDDGGSGTLSRLDVTLDPGTYTLIVDGYSSSSSGSYLLRISNGNSAVTGHAVMIGHDYFSSNAAQDRVVGNAVFLANTDAPVSVLAYTQHADTGAGGEAANTDAAIDARAAALGRRWIRDELTDHSQLSTRLPGHHVLLVYEQEDSDATEMATVGSDWAATVSDFVNNGGVVVVCDSYGGAWEVMNSSGLIPISATSPFFSGTVTVAAAGDEVAEGVSGTYSAANGSSHYRTTAAGVVVEHSSGNAVVIHERFGARGGSDFYALPYDYFAWDTAAAELLERAVTYGFPSVPVVGVVQECADTTSNTSTSSPGGPYPGEFNATIGALEHAGFPAANILTIADAADATARASEYDVLLFVETERCDLDSSAWRSPVGNVISGGGRVVTTCPYGELAAFVSGLGMFGSGSRSGVSEPFTTVDDPFWDGLSHPGSFSATGGWAWAGAGLIPLGYSSDGTTLTVWGYDI